VGTGQQVRTSTDGQCGAPQSVWVGCLQVRPGRPRARIGSRVWSIDREACMCIHPVNRVEWISQSVCPHSIPVAPQGCALQYYVHYHRAVPSSEASDGPGNNGPGDKWLEPHAVASVTLGETPAYLSYRGVRRRWLLLFPQECIHIHEGQSSQVGNLLYAAI
jgi:hypothetical protein